MARINLPEWLVFLVLLTIQVAGFNAYAADPRTSARFYVDTYGLVDPESDTRVDRAQTIFKRLLRVANRPSDLQPGLRVIDSEGQPWAIALPDGFVIISRGTLDVCYGGAALDVGDTRLALILGHELAHLTHHDFWHRDVHLTLGEQPNATSEDFRRRIAAFAGTASTGNPETWKEQVRQRELIADDQGFMFASLAGFPTSQLLEHSDGNRSFFDYWVSSTRMGVDTLHADTTERASLLRARFDSVKKKVELFDNGIRLLTLGRIDDAISFLRTFNKAYPAAAVNNNLGFAFLHRAFQSMHPDDAARFWLPGMVDVLNPLLEYRYLGGSDSSKTIKGYLETAVAYLEKAADTDPDHLASRINLATAHWYLGDYHKARAVIEEARGIDPANMAVLSLRALILQFQEQDIDMWPVASGILKNLASVEPAPLPVLFNLARMMEQRSRASQALEYWNQLYIRRNNLPEIYRQVVCEKAQGGPCDAPGHAVSQSNIAEALIGRSVDGQADNTSQNWQLRRFNVDTTAVRLLDDSAGVQFLELDDHLEIVIVEARKEVNLPDFERLTGSPVAVWPMARGEIRIYPGQIVTIVEDGRIVSAWWSRS